MMLHGHDEMLLHLPGTAEERKWLEKHLEVLSVKERIALTAMWRIPEISTPCAMTARNCRT